MTLLLRYALIDNVFAEIDVPGLGRFSVNGSDRILHPLTPACSERMYQNILLGLALPIVDVMDTIEDLASELFPDASIPWTWGLHDVGAAPAN
jgi:hypothetical protein